MSNVTIPVYWKFQCKSSRPYSFTAHFCSTVQNFWGVTVPGFPPCLRP